MIDIATILRDADWNKKEPAQPELVQVLASASVGKLPNEYLSLLLYSDGGEGKLAIEPGWFQLWPAADVFKQNKSYKIDEILPGYFGFGSNGGSELLAFDFKHGKPYRVVRIPFVPMDEKEAITITNNFEEFIQAIGHRTK
jgi:hypothetical protein